MTATRMAGRMCPLQSLGEVCNVGPQDRQYPEALLGVFDAYHGWNEESQFPAIWRHKDSSIHQSMSYQSQMLGWFPKPGLNYIRQIWSQSGTLQITRRHSATIRRGSWRPSPTSVL